MKVTAKKETEEKTALPRSQRLDAISWAANKAGSTYGKFSATLTGPEKERIYEEYARLLAAKRREEQKRLAALTTSTKKA